MPKIFQYLNYIIRFYSNDHLPIHVHVQNGQAESKVDFLIEGNKVTLVFKRIRGKTPLTEQQSREVGVFLKEYHSEIIEKWQRVFIRQERVKCEVIRTKIKRK
jgi:hypothetical protein